MLIHSCIYHKIFVSLDKIIRECRLFEITAIPVFCFVKLQSFLWNSTEFSTESYRAFQRKLQSFPKKTTEKHASKAGKGF
ncbi:hypothetical protein D0T85_16295 [Bacteroides sp. 519]|nr:hypothetical protein [Bacteroides sp. 519]